MCSMHPQMVLWLQVLRLSPWLPALEELHACGNGIRSLAADGVQGGARPDAGMLAHLQVHSCAHLLYLSWQAAKSHDG